MKKLKTKKLKAIYNTISNYDKENKEMTFEIPSLLKFCFENDIRNILENKNLSEEEINKIFDSLDFDVYLKQLKTNKNKIKVSLSYKDLNSFINNYLYHNDQSFLKEANYN